jgi:hypothetical protein
MTMPRRHESLTRRVPLLLDEARYRKVERVARREGISVAAAIRAAIDAVPVRPDRQRAVDAILGADPMPLPAEPARIRDEVDSGRDRLP